METLVDSRPVRAPLRTGSRPSTTQEKTEFRELLNLLGVDRLRPFEPRSQTVRCFAHADKKPSLSVNLEGCVFHCHSCGTKGGLIQLRQHAGTAVRDTQGKISPALEQLSRLGSLNAHPLSLVPVEAVEELRQRTNRHKRDGRLNDHLRLLLALIAQQMLQEGHTRQVRFTATDARLGGLRGETWSDLLPLLRYFGLDVEKGQSGRTLDLAKVRIVNATLVTLRSFRNTPVTTSSEVSSAMTSTLTCSNTPAKYSDFDPFHFQVTIQAAQAVQAKPDENVEGASVWRAPSVARLVGMLANLHGEIPASGGKRGERPATTTAHLREVLRSSPWRAVHRAESLGLVTVIRANRRHAVIELTDEGRKVWERDVERGVERLCGQVTDQLVRWMKAQDEARRRERERSERAVIDFTTGEVITRNAGHYGAC